jgi:hypothetical protein
LTELTGFFQIYGILGRKAGEGFDRINKIYRIREKAAELILRQAQDDGLSIV